MRRAALLALVVLALGLALPVAAPARSASPRLSVAVEDAGAFPEVTLAITLPPEALSASAEPAFELSENGAGVELVRVVAESGTREPLDVVLLIDTSGSMAGAPLADAKAAAKEFLGSLGSGDRVALVSFAFTPTVVSGFTADRAGMTAAIDELSATGETAVHDALVTAARLAGDSPNRTALVLLSDGGDTVSINSFDSAVAAVKAAGSPVFAVVLESAEWDPEALQVLATASGGRYLGATGSAQLATLYQGIARELRSRYFVTYTSLAPNTKDLEVLVSARVGDVSASGATVLANPRYSSAPPDAASPLTPPKTGGWRPAAVVTLTFLAVTGLVAVLGLMLARPRVRLERLDFYDQTAMPRPEGATDPQSPGAVRARMLDAVGYVAGRRGFTLWLRERLERAGLPLRPVEYMYLHILFVITTGVLAALATGSMLASMSVVLLAVVVPLLLLENAIERRRARFEEQLPEVLNLIAGSLRAGWGLLQSVGLVTEQMAPPTSTEFARVQTEARLGLPVEEALQNMAERLDSDDFRWTVSAIAIQRDVGGNLAEVLDIVAGTMRDRAELRRHIRSLTAEGRLSGGILILLPIVELVILMLVNRTYMDAMFSHPFGWFLAFVGIALLLVGAVWLRRAMAVEV